MKRYLLISLVALMFFSLCACQSTPENEVVAGKDNLVNKISEASSDENNIDAPEKWQDSLELAEQDLSITIDAEVRLTDSKSYPVIRIAPAEMTQEQADIIINTLFGDTPVYKPRDESILTKSEIEDEIIRLRSGEGSDLKVSDPDAYEQWAAPQIEALMQQYESAPEIIMLEQGDINFGTKKIESTPQYTEDGEIMPQDPADLAEDNYRQINVTTDFGATLQAYKSEDNYLSYIEFYNYPDGYISGSTQDMVALDGLNVDEALALASKTAKGAGFSEMTVSATGIKKLYSPSNESLPDMYCYVFVFTPAIGENAVTATSEMLSGLITGAADAYGAVWPAERIIVEVGDDGILRFNWRSPSETIETIAQNAQLLSFEDVAEKFISQMKIQNIWSNDDTVVSREVIIEQAVLGYAVIADGENAGEFLLVPVWDFFGHTITTYDDATQSESNSFITSYLTINAIDGTIIDRNAGY